MKKILSLCAMLCLALSLCAGIPSVASAAAGNAQYVYVYNTQGWDLYGYCYEGSATIGEEWNQVKLDFASEIGEYWYKYEVPREAEGRNAVFIIYNKKKDKERITANVPSDSKIYFNTYRNTGFATPAEAEQNNSKKVYETTGDTRAYFYNSERWQTVTAYVWGTEEYLDGWPGTTATKDETRENWYYVNINQDCTKKNINVIFNNDNNGEQAESVLVNKSVVYVNVEGVKFESFEACEAVTPMAKTAEDFMMDFTKLDTAQKTDSVTEYPSLTAPIVVLSVAGVACVALGTVLVVFKLRRKKK